MESRLQQAFDALEGGKRWSKGRYARDQHGVTTFIKSPTAETFCSVGSLARVWDVEITDTINAGYSKDLEQLAKASKQMGFNSPSQLNDDPNTTFELITGLFKAAQEI